MSCTTCVNSQTTWKYKQRQHNVAGKTLLQSQGVKIKAGESLFNRITWLLIPLGQINHQFFMNSRGCGLTSPGEPLFDIYCMISEHHGMSHKETKEGKIFIEEEHI